MVVVVMISVWLVQAMKQCNDDNDNDDDYDYDYADDDGSDDNKE